MNKTEISKKLTTIEIDSSSGTETLAEAADVFTSWIDSDFKNWNTNKPGITTKEQAVDVHELIQDATFAQMFGSLGTDLDKLCLTQAQIKNFCKKHPNWLRTDGYATFFLFKVEDQFFVARVDVQSAGLRVSVHRFEYDRVWDAEDSRRMVVPQLETQELNPASSTLKSFDSYTNMLEWLYINSGNQMSNEFKEKLLKKLKEILK